MIQDTMVPLPLSIEETGTRGGATNASLYNANNMPVVQGDAILTFLDDEPATAIDYSNSQE